MRWQSKEDDFGSKCCEVIDGSVPAPVPSVDKVVRELCTIRDDEGVIASKHHGGRLSASRPLPVRARNELPLRKPFDEPKESLIANQVIAAAFVIMVDGIGRFALNTKSRRVGVLYAMPARACRTCVRMI